MDVVGGSMERTHQYSQILSLFIGLVCLMHASTALSAEYSYHVDYFKVEGNLPVPQQDNFNDGNLSPWVVHQGTVEESGGSATLKNPGYVENMGTTVLESSELNSSANSPFNISVGSGNAKATSRWITNVKPALGHVYMMRADFEFITGSPATDGEIYFITGMVNADQLTADAISMFAGTPVPTGLFAFFEVGRYVSDSDETQIFQVAPIADPTLFDAGSLFLNLYYNEDDQEASADIVFGNDENGLAWEPFNTVAIPTHPGILVFDKWELEATTFSAVPIPAALPLFGSAIALFGFIGRKRRKVT
jgi:hypothetical protein